MNDIVLRPYQREFIDNVRSEFVALKRHGDKPAVVGVAPCGAGKTIMTGWMIRESLERGKRSIFFVHRKELIRQTSDTFTRLEIPHGIIAANTPMQLDLPVQIASVQTLARRLKEIPAPDFLICDECHHILAKTYREILDAFPNAYLLGVTATPERLGGITLCDVFNSMVTSLSVDELIKLGNLTPFRYFAPNNTDQPDLSDIKITAGDYNNAQLARAMADKKIIGGIVDNYKKFAAGKSTICYCVNVDHSKTVADAFMDAGIIAAHCDGNTPAAERDNIVDHFRRGHIQVLCNAELFGEGFDVPHMQAVILARPTQSLTLYIQQALRPLRPDPHDPNKVAVIIDHVQNYLRHGFPNQNHRWTLDPNPPKREAPAFKVCPECGNAVAPREKICPCCGHEFKGQYIPPDTTEYTGDIVEFSTVNDAPAPDNKIIRAANTPEAFLEIAKERKYQIGWVAHQSIKFAKTKADFDHIAEICGYKRGWSYYKWQEHCETKNLQSARLS